VQNVVLGSLAHVRCVDLARQKVLLPQGLGGGDVINNVVVVLDDLTDLLDFQFVDWGKLVACAIELVRPCAWERLGDDHHVLMLPMPVPPDDPTAVVWCRAKHPGLSRSKGEPRVAHLHRTTQVVGSNTTLDC
jgi:hypothetical protein